MNKLFISHLQRISVLVIWMFLSGFSAGSIAAFPVDLRGQAPEQASAVINASKPAGAGTATVTLTTYDADFPTEGKLVINGNAPVALFGAEGVKANDRNSASITIKTPASYWKNGSNMILFKHTSTQGFVVDAAKVSFETATTSTTSDFPVDLRGQAPEQASAVINASKPAGAGTATVTLTTYDADFPTEGKLVINGNAPVALFGAEGVKANDRNSASITIKTPASYWKNGNNMLLFKHTSTQGFVVDAAKVSFETATTTTTSDFPVDLRGQAPEQASAVINASKPAGAGTATVTLTTYDADFPTEGKLVINGNAPVALFGAEGVKANDRNSASITIKTPASYWKNGNNMLLFKHTSTQGFVVDAAKVSFETATPSNAYFALADLPSTLLSSGLSASGPIVLRSKRDVVISGLHITNPKGSCIEIRNGSSNITIENSVIGPCAGNGVNIIEGSHNVTVIGNYIHDAVEEGVRSRNSHNITVDSNMIENVKSGYGMWTTSVGNLSFTNNYVKYVHRGSGYGGNVVSVAFVHAKGIRIANNVGINSLGKSDTEDLISVYKSDGTPTDPIQIYNNQLYGSGPSLSGGGILLGDGGGSYQEARGNVLVNPGQYGIGIASGHHHVLSNNKVYSDPQQSHANVGIGIGWTAGQKGLDCYSLEVSNNEVTWWKGSDFNGGFLDPYYKWFGCGTSGWNTNKLDKPNNNRPASLDETILPETIRNL